MASRRQFIKQTGLVTLAGPLVSSSYTHFISGAEDALEVHLFSKHLQFLDIKHAAHVAVEIGFSGLDLTVRPKGHVLPENVKTDLPAAIRDIEAVSYTHLTLPTTPYV